MPQSGGATIELVVLALLLGLGLGWLIVVPIDPVITEYQPVTYSPRIVQPGQSVGVTRYYYKHRSDCLGRGHAIWYAKKPDGVHPVGSPRDFQEPLSVGQNPPRTFELSIPAVLPPGATELRQQFWYTHDCGLKTVISPATTLVFEVSTED